MVFHVWLEAGKARVGSTMADRERVLGLVADLVIPGKGDGRVADGWENRVEV